MVRLTLVFGAIDLSTNSQWTSGQQKHRAIIIIVKNELLSRTSRTQTHTPNPCIIVIMDGGELSELDGGRQKYYGKNPKRTF